MRAQTAVPVNEVIALRRSPRSLNESTTISDTDLLGILEAARWAPSAFNGQPWRFFVGKRGDATFTHILDALVEFNQGWAKSASALILVAAQPTRDDGSIHADYQFDCGLAVAQLVIETHDRGLVAHQMTGFDKDKARSNVEMASELVPVVVIAIGKEDSAEKLPTALAERELAPRGRKSLDEIVVKGLPKI
ncbi:MAG: nitroreductase family protein [Candidatus Planktophila sp.]|jgi:nitroreductase|nr:nitroreductase family protein [Candidatus Planktophila sp.]